MGRRPRHLEHPAGGHPRPGAERVEPEVDPCPLARHGSSYGYGCSRSVRTSTGMPDRIPVGPAGPHDRLRRMGVPNLTRTEARARADLLAVTAYEVELDLTDGGGKPGERTFRSRTTIRFTASAARRGDVRRRDRGRVPRGHPQRAGARHVRLHAGGRARAARPGRRQRARGRRRPASTPTPARGCTGSSTRSTARSTSTRSSRPRTPSGCTPASTSPTSRRTFTLTVTAPHALGGRLQRARGRGHRGRRRRAGGPVPHHAAALAVRHRAGRRAVPQGDRQPRRHRPRRLLPGLAGRAPRRRRDPAGHQAGLRLVSPRVRLPLPVRQVRPAVRARVQRRRDGERGLRHLPRRLRLPLEGHRLLVRAARRDDPARDGAHVVRRPGHHALVGRPLAERVVRQLRRRCSRRRRRPGGPRPGPRSRTSRRPGRTGRISCPPRTRSPPTSPTCRRSRSTSTASRTRRAPACSSSWPRTWGSRSSCGRCGSTSAGTSTATPRSPTCSACSARSPAGTCPAGRSCGWRRPGSTRCGPDFTLDETGPVHVVRGPAAPAEPGPAEREGSQRDTERARSCVITGSRSGCTAPRATSWSAPSGSRWT